MTLDWTDIARLDQVIDAHRDNPATAVVEAGTGARIGYDALNARVRDIAQRLTAAGVRPGDKVVVRATKSIGAVAAILAAMRVGATSVPVDPEMPADRLTHILAISAARFVVAPDNVPPADYAARHLADLPEGFALSLREAGRPGKAEDADIAYVIFTSGSTGRPKGVPISHRAALAFLGSAQARVGYRPPMVFLNASPLFFDASILDVFLTLALGGELVLAPKIVLPSQIGRYLEEFRVTDTLMVSSLLKLMVGRFGDLAERDLSRLRSVWYGAEPCAVRVLKELKAQAPQVRLIHGYGPTEATHTTTMYVTDTLTDADDSYLPIGTPLATVEVRVVDADLRPVAPGAVGELLISGAQLFEGYLGAPDQTAAAFVELDGQRFYRSNDLVRTNAQGDLVFVGRRDEAVKVQGYLVYLREIESAAANIPGIQDAVASVYRTGDATEDMAALALHYLSDRTWSDSDLLAALSRKLPKYMLPTRLTRVAPEADMLLPTGKLNRRLLTDPGAARPAPAASPAP